MWRFLCLPLVSLARHHFPTVTKKAVRLLLRLQSLTRGSIGRQVSTIAKVSTLRVCTLHECSLRRIRAHSAGRLRGSELAHSRILARTNAHAHSDVY